LPSKHKALSSSSGTQKLNKQTSKLLEENIGLNLHDLGLNDSFSDTTPKATKVKNKEIGSHQKFKLLCFKEHL
jgi:regulator of replication initiation timing